MDRLPRHLHEELHQLFVEAPPPGEQTGEELLDRLPAEARQSPTMVLSEPVVAAVVDQAKKLRLATQARRLPAQELADAMERRPETRARLLLRGHDPFETWVLTEELMERTGRALRASDPCRAVRLARLAVAAAGHLDSELYGRALAADLQARAWGQLGNAFRCASQLPAAATALARARHLIEEGTGDPLEQAHLLGLRASLATTRGDFEGALALLDPALRIYRELGERRLEGRTLIQSCAAAGYLDAAEGAELALEAEELLQAPPEPDLLSMARHNRIVWLVESGRAQEARALLDASGDLLRDFENSPWLRLHLAWTEARLAFAEGDLDGAETRFEALLTDLLAHRHPLEAALCALDLAACHLVAGRPRRASELAATMAGHLREWGAHARAREAWALLQHSLSAERASEDLIRELGAYLQRAWNDPRRSFGRV